MRRLRGRRLHPESGPGDRYCDADDRCSSSSPPLPPPVLPHATAPAPAPLPSERASPKPWPPDAAPSPAPIPTASWGRRDQGRVHGYGSPPGGGGDHNHNRRLVTSALIAVAAVAFVSLILLGVSVAVRRRQVRRRRQALLAAPAAAPEAPTDTDEPGGGGGAVVHHVWYIRTAGLDEADISSIAATRYRAGAGLLGAADCTVCLGEFQDGELLRLLPKCGHAFHVPCIDTWLRAHVNCPLCRSDVLDPAVTTDAGGGESSPAPPADPVDGSNATVAELADATGEALLSEHEQEEGDHPEATPAEEDPQEQFSLPEPPPPQQQQLPHPLPHNVRRAASMDAAIMSTAAYIATALELLPEAAPEGEQSGRRKRGPGKASGSGHGSNLSTDRPASPGMPRSFFARHCRARSSVLPL